MEMNAHLNLFFSIYGGRQSIVVYVAEAVGKPVLLVKAAEYHS